MCCGIICSNGGRNRSHTGVAWIGKKPPRLLIFSFPSFPWPPVCYHFKGHVVLVSSLHLLPKAVKPQIQERSPRRITVNRPLCTVQTAASRNTITPDMIHKCWKWIFDIQSLSAVERHHAPSPFEHSQSYNQTSHLIVTCMYHRHDQKKWNQSKHIIGCTPLKAS